MKDALRLALIAVAAYFAYRQFTAAPEAPQGNGPAATEPTTPAPTTPATQPATQPTTPPATPADPIVIIVKAAAIEAGYANSLGWDQWNWFYNQVTGRAGPAPESVGLPRIADMPNITAEAWAAVIRAGGIEL